ncbi:metallophosphoesterase [Pseudodesulfovibrio cashew]|uniref:Metallophosphoesterase n=1 Tax=Pseudodesulfovibrio cashew TaxID=2678688 RepID=A0A6I6J975_9BACT|nr:metallophosphoesterase [Pseudodesulfovibrio cashew]QGY39155.1 metallophosphoesterase [Pseudodesulfovibrio cashew]
MSSGPITRRKFLAMVACAAVVPYAMLNRTEELTVTRQTIAVHTLPTLFSGFTICHLSDLHSREYGAGNRELLRIIDEHKPDLIAMTGDMIDKRRCDESVCLHLCREAARIAPAKFVTGNHEMTNFHQMIQHRLRDTGVDFLDNRNTILQRGGDKVYLAGAGEYNYYGKQSIKFSMNGIPEDACSIVLSHHPEIMEEFSNRKANLILSGHTHGGQIRLPFAGAVIAPDQWVFPRYTDGLYRKGGTAMYVSRGLGNSIIPLRLNCPPEIAFLTLEPAA